MQNFGKIKNMFNSLLVEAMVTNDVEKKKLFKEYVQSIKTNEVLKAQFLVYDNIETKVEVNEHKATEFVKANIEVLNKYPKAKILEENNKLLGKLKTASVNDNYELAQLHEDISTLIFADRNPKNVDCIVESLTSIVDYIKENEIKNKDVVEAPVLPNSVVSEIIVNKFNEKYSELTEDEQRVLKSIIDADDNGKKEIFKALTRECVELVDKHLVESEVETKEKLLMTKDRLLRLEYVEESFITDISKLIELKSDLSE